jgi:ribosomal protein S27E
MKEKRKAGNQFQLKPKSFEYGKPDQYGTRKIWIPPERKVRCCDCGFPWENTKLDKKKRLDFVNIKCPNCGGQRLVHHEGMDEWS